MCKVQVVEQQFGVTCRQDVIPPGNLPFARVQHLNTPQLNRTPIMRFTTRQWYLFLE